MASYSTALLDPTTSAKTGIRFLVERSQVPARISCTGLAGSEKYTLKLVDGAVGSEQITTAYQDGAVVTYTATSPSGGIFVPGVYELAKDATASASGVYLY